MTNKNTNKNGKRKLNLLGVAVFALTILALSAAIVIPKVHQAYADSSFNTFTTSDGVTITSSRQEVRSLNSEAAVEAYLKKLYDNNESSYLSIQFDGSTGKISKISDWDGFIPTKNDDVKVNYSERTISDTASDPNSSEKYDFSNILPSEDEESAEVNPTGIAIHDECENNNTWPCWWDSHNKHKVMTFTGAGNYTGPLDWRGDFYSRGHKIDVLQYHSDIAGGREFTNLPADSKIDVEYKDDTNVIGDRVSFQ